MISFVDLGYSFMMVTIMVRSLNEPSLKNQLITGFISLLSINDSFFRVPPSMIIGDSDQGFKARVFLNGS